MTAERVLRVGVVGLGRAFMIMLPTFLHDPRVRLVAAADPRPEARRRFEQDFAGVTYGSMEELCGDPDVEAVYIATPHQHHAGHATLAAAAGKHVLVEKPMALSLDECRRMIEAAKSARVQLVVGHSHSFNAPVLRARELIAGGAFGRVRMIGALNYTDFLYRPRRPEELETARGGGVIFSQAAHQIDILRLLGGGEIRTLRAVTGNWDASRPTEGAYSALMTFADGAFASAVYSGYGRFDSDEFGGWIGELGHPKNPEEYGAARRSLARARDAASEAALKLERNYGAQGVDRAAALAPRPAELHQSFGTVIVSCERADLRPGPAGVMIFDDNARRLESVPVRAVPRAEVIDELYGAVVHGYAPLHGGEWAMATLEACLAILQSAGTGREVELKHQVPAPSVIPHRAPPQ